MEERLQKILSRAGFGSRRECEEFIESGRVTVNGKLAELGMKVDPEQAHIRVDGIPVNYREPEKVYIAVNKPRFVLSDRVENDARQTVYDLVPNSESLFVVGRLDFESEGLVLMTNDGDLANKLTHPRFGKEKEYKVLLAKRPDYRQLEAWQRGVILEDGVRTAPAKVAITRAQGEGAWVRVVMKEGRKREIREICRTIGLPVVKLIRVRIGTLLLGQLQSREWANLKPQEVQALKDLVAGETPAGAAKTKVSSRPDARRSVTLTKRGAAPRRGSGSVRSEERNSDRPERRPYRTGSKPSPRREQGAGEPHSDRSEERSSGRPERRPYRARAKPSPRREQGAGESHSNRSEERSSGRPERKPFRAGAKPSPRREQGAGESRPERRSERKPFAKRKPSTRTAKK